MDSRLSWFDDLSRKLRWIFIMVMVYYLVSLIGILLLVVGAIGFAIWKCLS